MCSFFYSKNALLSCIYQKKQYLCTVFRHNTVVSSTYFLRTIYGRYTEDIRTIKPRRSREHANNLTIIKPSCVA